MPEAWDFDGYFFDLDGTIFLGERLLPGVSESLACLRRMGKRVLFLTNTTMRTRQECRMRLRQLGLEADVGEIVTAGYAAAVYLRERESEPLVFVVGEPALVSELDELGVKHTTDPLAATHVLVGMDKHFDYDKLHQAMKAVRNGAALIAANPDPNCPLENDIIPDTWAMVKAIETASGVEPHAVIGKPSAYYGVKTLELCGIPSERCLMVGDRLETDVLFGSVNGLRTALVLTGVATRNDVERSRLRPDFVWDSMEEFLAMARSAY